VIFIPHKGAADIGLQPRTSCIYRGRDGFTLIELIVVMSLISIIFFFAIPRLDTSFLTNRSHRVSNWIVFHVKSLKNKAVSQQKTYVMRLDLGENRISCFVKSNQDGDVLDQTEEKSVPSMGDETANNLSTEGLLEKGRKSEKEVFSLPQGFRLSDVILGKKTVFTTGTVDIHFYAKGYSDPAIIHVKDEDGNTVSYIIEPFLTHVTVKNDYVEF